MFGLGLLMPLGTAEPAHGEDGRAAKTWTDSARGVDGGGREAALVLSL